MAISHTEVIASLTKKRNQFKMRLGKFKVLAARNEDEPSSHVKKNFLRRKSI